MITDWLLLLANHWNDNTDHACLYLRGGKGEPRAIPVELPEDSLNVTPLHSAGHYKLSGISRMFAGLPGRAALNRTVEADVKRAWAQDSIALLETKGTREVRGESDRVN